MADDFETMARQIETIGCPGFDLQCSVAVDAGSGETVITVFAINNLDPDSAAIPTLIVPKGWYISKHWYHACSGSGGCCRNNLAGS